MEFKSGLELIVLGVIAGVVPVYVGIVVALFLKSFISRLWEGFLIGLTVGILVYLFFDLMHEAVELTGARDFFSWSVLLGSLFVGFVGVVALEQSQLRKEGSVWLVISLPYMIALGMGLHNLGEGLAIGTSYANGEWVLSGVLVAGFALHNGTEGFGIIGAAGRSSLSIQDIVLLGALAGVPTCIGTILSGNGVSAYFSLACYAVAAGSLLYVIIGLVAIYYTATRRAQVALGIFFGISLMFITAMLLTLAGGART